MSVAGIAVSLIGAAFGHRAAIRVGALLASSYVVLCDDPAIIFVESLWASFAFRASLVLMMTFHEVRKPSFMLDD